MKKPILLKDLLPESMHTDALDNANAPEGMLLAADNADEMLEAKRKKLESLKRRKGEAWRNYTPVETGMPKMDGESNT
jgi:hypothetical protein